MPGIDLGIVPNGASVEIGGKPVTGSHISLPHGKYPILVSMPGYDTVNDFVNVDSGNVRFARILTPSPLALRFDTNLENVVVRLDDKSLAENERVPVDHTNHHLSVNSTRTGAIQIRSEEHTSELQS